MIRYSKYDKDTRTDKVWYESSTVYFSKFIENENDNYGQLYITFKNGATYHYTDVDMPTDYILFKTGGIDASHGKTLNSRIKSKYEYTRLEDLNIKDLEIELENNIKMDKDIENKYNNDRDEYFIYFISGHRDLTIDEFNEYYIPSISDIIALCIKELDIYPRFVIGDCCGCDIMAQDYLLDTLSYNPELITVYHCNDNPRYVNPKVINLIGDFKDDIEKDAAMTNISHADIAFVRNNMEMSGTAQNILRRKMFTNLK